MIKILCTLIIVLICLVGLDLLTGIFYWNRDYLSFDPSTFNNLLSPIASICASIIYGATLYFIIKQTKIFRSQSIKPYFENEINQLQKKFDRIEMYFYRNGKAELLKPDEIIDEVSISINLVMLNQDFFDIQEKLKNKLSITESQIGASSFYGDIFILLGLTKPFNKYEQFYNLVILFINEVKLSSMTFDDKTFIVRKVVNSFFADDIILLDRLIEHNLTEIIIPVLYANDDENVGSIKLFETSFFKNIVRLKNILLEFTPELP